jgi:hypothetical protein
MFHYQSDDRRRVLETILHNFWIYWFVRGENPGPWKMHSLPFHTEEPKYVITSSGSLLIKHWCLPDFLQTLHVSFKIYFHPAPILYNIIPLQCCKLLLYVALYCQDTYYHDECCITIFYCKNVCSILYCTILHITGNCTCNILRTKQAALLT